MGTKTTVNNKTVVHKDSGGVVNTTDICKTQVGNTIVPIPYNNVAKSEDTSKGSKTVKVEGNSIMLEDSEFSKSSGDEPGNHKGVMSGTKGDIAKFINYSFDVKVEGKCVCRNNDLMTSNNSNTPPAPINQDNLEGELKEFYVLSAAFVFKEPDLISQKICQPELKTLANITGPESHTLKDAGYRGMYYNCKQSGEYDFAFNKFNREERKFS